MGKPLNLKRMDLVVVRWVDSCGSSAEVWSRVGATVASCRESVKDENVSVGFVLHGDDQCLVIASHLSTANPGDDDQCSGEMAIPVSAIVGLRKVKA